MQEVSRHDSKILHIAAAIYNERHFHTWIMVAKDDLSYCLASGLPRIAHPQNALNAAVRLCKGYVYRSSRHDHKNHRATR